MHPACEHLLPAQPGERWVPRDGTRSGEGTPGRGQGAEPRRPPGPAGAAGGLRGGEEVQSWGRVWGSRRPAAAVPARVMVAVRGRARGAQGCSQARRRPSARAMATMTPLPSRNPTFCRRKWPQGPSPGPSAPRSTSGSWGRAGVSGVGARPSTLLPPAAPLPCRPGPHRGRCRRWWRGPRG